MRTVAAVVWCGVWGVVWCGAARLVLMHATREDDGHWRIYSAGCRPRGACFRSSKRWALSPSTKSASKASVAEAVSNGMLFSYAWRELEIFVFTQ